MNARILFRLSAVCLAVGGVSAFAQDVPHGRKLAVVVGNNEYRPNQGLNNLKQAVNDARRLSEVLRKSGFTVIEMTHDAASQPGKAVLAPNADYIRDQIDGVIESPNLGEHDTILISLHGHGVKFDFEEKVVKSGREELVKTPKFFFCPADSAPAGIKTANELTERNHLIPLDELYKKLEVCKAATKLLIVDACRNDPNQGNFRESLASVTRPKLPPPPGGIAAFFSCKENQRAIEDADLKQGVFTHFLIQGLEGKADQPLEGKPADGIITLSELTTYVANNTHSYVLDKYNGTRQSPDIKGEFDANLPVARLSTGTSPTIMSADRSSNAKVEVNSIGMKLVLIPAGEFEMGSSLTPKDLAAKFSQWNVQEEWFEGERPPHRVKISRPFDLGQHEVTIGQFRKFVDDDGYKTEAESDSKGGFGFDEEKIAWYQDRKFTWKNPGFTQLEDHPVVNVSWNDTQKFCEWLSRKEGRTYRLPTEAEWEYACKAGTSTLWSNGDDPEATARIGNVADGTAKAKFSGFEAIIARDGYVFTAPVGKFPANPFGLFDMHGNVQELCEDSHDFKAYASRSGTTVDPRSTEAGSLRVSRGGCWNLAPHFTRSTARAADPQDHRDYALGFRVVRTRQESEKK